MHMLGTTRHDLRLPIAIAGSAVLATLGVFYAAGQPAQAADAGTRVPLATTQTFGVLAGAGITNSDTNTAIKGDVGSYETPSVDGLLPGQVTGGVIRRSDLVPGDEAIMVKAKDDLVAAYDDAAQSNELVEPRLVETELGDKTLTAGVYENPTLGLTGELTLDGGNADGAPSDSVFVFKTGTAGSTLITASNSSVELTGGAQACNVFWQVGSSATFGSGTDFVGTVMALTSIQAEAGATFEGRLLARNASVTLIDNTITRPGCEQAVDDDTAGDDDTGGDDTDTTGGDTDTDGTDATGGDDSDSDTANGGATDGSSTISDGDADGGDTTGGTTGLPQTGGESPWVALLGAASLLAGTVIVRRLRYRPTHSL